MSLWQASSLEAAGPFSRNCQPTAVRGPRRQMAKADVHRTLNLLRSNIRNSTRRAGGSPGLHNAYASNSLRIRRALRGRQGSVVVSAGRSAAMRELEAGREERRAQELEARRPVGTSEPLSTSSLCYHPPAPAWSVLEQCSLSSILPPFMQYYPICYRGY